MGDPFVRPGVACETYNDLILRHPGTGHSDTSMHQWLTQQHRDTLASIAGHYDRVLHLSVAENVAVARLRHQLIDELAGEPCGPPPKRSIDEISGQTSGVLPTGARAGATRAPRSEASRAVPSDGSAVLTAADADMDDGATMNDGAYGRPVLASGQHDDSAHYGAGNGIGH